MKASAATPASAYAAATPNEYDLREAHQGQDEHGGPEVPDPCEQQRKARRGSGGAEEQRERCTAFPQSRWLRARSPVGNRMGQSVWGRSGSVLVVGTPGGDALRRFALVPLRYSLPKLPVRQPLARPNALPRLFQ